MLKKGILFLLVFILTFSCVCYAAPAPNYDVHNITSNDMMYLQDGETGTWYNRTEGNCIVSWRDRTQYGFFNARVTTPPGDSYEFQLISVDICDDDFIEGFFDISRNGVLVAPAVHGRLYGLNLSVGQYFKFYDDAMEWHMSAYIIYRFDY